MDGPGQDPGSHERLWEFIPLADYRSPQRPTASAARERWASLRRLFGKWSDGADKPAKAEGELGRLPQQRLDVLVRPLDWDASAAALDSALAQSAGEGPVSFVIGPPHSGQADLLRCWAAKHDAPSIEAPRYEDILAGDGDWLAAWPSGAAPWVLPRLEHCWLRHAAGLGLVRELLQRALAGELGRGLIGCDSWAWSYLGHVVPLVASSVMTLQAFDGRRLARLFRSLAAVEGAGGVRFCDARTGKVILAIDDDDDGDGGPALQHLAARARGNPGTARVLWRAWLRSEPEAVNDRAKAGAGERGDLGIDQTVWVSGLRDGLELPGSLDEEAALVLHALLLHNGLPASILADLLPMHRVRVHTVVLQLAAAGIIARDGADRWRVTAPAYAAVRVFLHGLGFLIDAL